MEASEADTVEINVAYGTEKQQWLEGATAEFQKTSAGRSIKVNLHGMGSMEGARAVLDGPKPIPFQVWSPASSAYRDAFEQEWRAKHANKPILKSDNLALTPMVFVMWEDRREAFIKKYSKPSFQTVSQAMGEQGGGSRLPSRRSGVDLTLAILTQSVPTVGCSRSCSWPMSTPRKNATSPTPTWRTLDSRSGCERFFTALLGPAGRSHRVPVP